MPVQKIGVFTINYTVVTNAAVGCDIQFGMNFTVTGTVHRPLCQLIYPATAVGNNGANAWNIDNHIAGNDAHSLIFNGADNGIINDGPRELCKPNRGEKTTEFRIYFVDIAKSTIQSKGVRFGYSINTNAKAPQTSFIDLKPSNISDNEKKVIIQKCSYIKFI